MVATITTATVSKTATDMRNVFMVLFGCIQLVPEESSQSPALVKSRITLPKTTSRADAITRVGLCANLERKEIEIQTEKSS